MKQFSLMKTLVLCLFFPSFIKASIEEHVTFSQRYTGVNIEPLTPAQSRGYEVIIKLMKSWYGNPSAYENIIIELYCEVISQNQFYERRSLLSQSHNVRVGRESKSNRKLSDIFAQVSGIDIEFVMSWRSINSEIRINQMEYANNFMAFMNSELGYGTMIEYMQELGIKVDQVHPLRLVDSSASEIEATDPPIQLEEIAYEPSLVIEQFSITLIGPNLDSMNDDQITALSIFLELFTSEYGASGGEPNVSTHCDILGQELSLTLLRERDLQTKEENKNHEARHLYDPESNLRYYLEIKFLMKWKASSNEIDLVTENYLEDFINFVDSEVGQEALQNRLLAVGLRVDEFSTLRIISKEV